MMTISILIITNNIKEIFIFCDQSETVVQFFLHSTNEYATLAVHFLVSSLVINYFENFFTKFLKKFNCLLEKNYSLFIIGS